MTLGRIEVHVGFVLMACVIVLLSTALALTYYTKTIDHQANIVTSGKVQTYLDAQCTQSLDNRNWGSYNTSQADDTKTLDFYLKNEGNVPVSVTWITSDFTSYNSSDAEYATLKWVLYLVKVEAGELRVKPENDTTPDKLLLSSGEVVHLKFYLTALASSSPDDFTFQTSFNSKDS